MSHSILVGGIGNIFLGDDAFGVAVVRRLAESQLPASVRLRDFGIRGIDLTYALMEDYDHAILIDAAPRGGAPGTLYVIEPSWDEIASDESAAPSMEMHNLDPVRVMRIVKYLGGPSQRMTIVGCEPSQFDAYDMEAGLSPAVAAAIEPAVLLVQRLVAQCLAAQNGDQLTLPLPL